VAEAIDVKGLTYITKNEEDLHLDVGTARSNRPTDAVKEAKVTSTDICDVRIAVNGLAIESFRIERIFGKIKGVSTSFRLYPDFSIFPDMAETIRFRIDDSNLSAYWDHTRILDE